MKAIESIRDSNRGYSDKYEILNLFAVDLLKELLEEVQTKRIDYNLYSSECYPCIDWDNKKNGDYISFDELEYLINSKLKELKNIT